MNLLPSSNPTHCHPYLSHTCSDRRLRRGSLTGISHQSYTAAYHWSARGHTNTVPSCVYVCMCVCVCVCACVIYVLLNLTIFHTIPVVDFLCISDPFAIPATRRLRCLHCYTPTNIHHHVRLLDFVLSRHPQVSRRSLNPPRREQCHHRPIRQLRSLPDAHPFFLRSRLCDLTIASDILALTNPQFSEYSHFRL